MVLSRNVTFINVINCEVYAFLPVIFLVMSVIFVVIVLCSLCEVYRSYRKHKQRREEEADTSVMWHHSGQPTKYQDPLVNSSIKMTAYKNVSYTG
jgi:high-affinity nickel permease